MKTSTRANWVRTLGSQKCSIHNYFLHCVVCQRLGLCNLYMADLSQVHGTSILGVNLNSLYAKLEPGLPVYGARLLPLHWWYRTESKLPKCWTWGWTRVTRVRDEAANHYTNGASTRDPVAMGSKPSWAEFRCAVCLSQIGSKYIYTHLWCKSMMAKVSCISYIR